MAETAHHRGHALGGQGRQLVTSGVDGGQGHHGGHDEGVKEPGRGVEQHVEVEEDPVERIPWRKALDSTQSQDHDKLED